MPIDWRHKYIELSFGFVRVCCAQKLGCHTSIVIKHCLVYASIQCISFSFKCKWKWKWGSFSVSKMVFLTLIISSAINIANKELFSEYMYLYFHFSEPIQSSIPIWYQCLTCDFLSFCLSLHIPNKSHVFYAQNTKEFPWKHDQRRFKSTAL